MFAPEAERTPALVGGVEVSDGDSLRLGTERIRLKGLDAPELAQTCTDAKGASWPCGTEARRILTRIIGGAPVSCDPFGRDQYERILARCRAGKIDIGAEMVREGYAVAYGSYETEEAAARAARRGLWAGEFERPREYRDESRQFDLLGWIQGWLP